MSDKDKTRNICIKAILNLHSKNGANVYQIRKAYQEEESEPLGRNEREALDILRQVPDIYQENNIWFPNSAKSGHIVDMIVHQNTKGRRAMPPRRNSTAFDRAEYERFRNPPPRYEPYRRDQRSYVDRDRENSDNRPNYASSTRRSMVDRSNDRSNQNQASPLANVYQPHVSSASSSNDRHRNPSTRTDYSHSVSAQCNSNKMSDRRPDGNTNNDIPYNATKRQDVVQRPHVKISEPIAEKKVEKPIAPKMAGVNKVDGKPNFVLSKSKEVVINGRKCLSNEQLHTFDFIGDDYMLYYILFHTKIFDSNVKHWSLCKKGQTIADAIQVVKRLPMQQDRRVIINIGITDITQGNKFEDLRKEFNDLINLCIEKKMKPIITTLVPFDAADMKTMKRLHNFNIHLKKNYKNVVDFFNARTLGLCNVLYSLMKKNQNRPRLGSRAAFGWGLLAETAMLKIDTFYEV